MVPYPAVSLVSINPAGSHNHSARDARALAQDRLSLLLALEVAPTGRATADRHGAPRIDPADERRKSALGRATHPRRTAQARVWDRAVERRQVHGHRPKAISGEHRVWVLERIKRDFTLRGLVA